MCCAGTSLLLARTCLQYAAGQQPWRRIEANLRSACPSVDVKGLLAAVEGQAVVSRAQLSDVVDGCLADGALITDSLARGGSVHATNLHGWGPLHEAARARAHRLLPLLLEAAADPHAQAMYGLTPLHIAVSVGDGVTVSQLLRHDPSILGVLDEHGRTAFDLACLYAEHSHHYPFPRENLREHRWPAWLQPVVAMLQQFSDTPLGCIDSDTATVDFDQTSKLVSSSSVLEPVSGESLSVSSESVSVSADELSELEVFSGGAATMSSQGRQAALLDSKQGQLPRAIQMAAIQPCGIAQRDGAHLTPEQFVRDFLSISRPVIVRRAALSTAGSKARRALLRKWSTASLSTIFGDRPFDVGQVPKPKTFAGVSQKDQWSLPLALAHLLTNVHITTGMNSTTMSLREFVRTRLVRRDGSDHTFPDYIFDSISSAEASKLLSMSVENSRMLPLTPNITNIASLVVDYGTIQFSLGAPLSGACSVKAMSTARI